MQNRLLGGDGKVYPRKERKLIIRDPLIARAMELWTRRKLSKDILYEWLVQEHLYRRFGEIYYFRNSYEVDAIADELKVEIKSGKIRGRYPKDVKVLTGKDIPNFLYELGKR